MTHCFVALLLFFCASVMADFKRDYTIAKKSFEDADYSDAIQKLKSVIADNPASKARVKLYGMRFDSYIPHYYLGQSYFKLNDCASAEAAWNQAINAGVIQELDEFVQMQAGLKICKSKDINITGIAAEANEKIDGLDQVINEYAGLQNETLLAQQWPSKWQPLLDQARQLSQTLRKRLDIATGEIDPDAITAIGTEATRAVAALSGNKREALAQVEAIKSQNVRNDQLARENELRKLQKARADLQEAIRLANAAEKPQGGSSQMNALLTHLNRQVSAGENLGSTAPELNIREQTQIIGNVLRRYELSVQDWQALQQDIAKRTPPPSLKKVAEAYFTGDYEMVTRLADPEGTSDDRVRIQALLFRAAANHKLYVRSGEQNEETLHQVQNDIRAIKRINNTFSPYIAAFSPKFLSLFQQSA